MPRIYRFHALSPIPSRPQDKTAKNRKKPKKSEKQTKKPAPASKKAEKEAAPKEKGPAAKQKETAKTPASADKSPTKGPAGSPAVHAPDLPARKAEPKPTKTAKKSAKTAEKKKRTTRPVTFDYANPEAEKVSLVGMFLVRSGGSKPMFKNSMGVWKITVYLNIGYTYRYQFEVIDKNGNKKLTPVKTIDVF